MNAPEIAQLIKGWEYIIAILSVLCFVGFWRLVNYRPPTHESMKDTEADD